MNWFYISLGGGYNFPLISEWFVVLSGFVTWFLTLGKAVLETVDESLFGE